MLQRKVPLKAKTKLKAKTELKRNTPLKANACLKQHSTFKSTSGLKQETPLNKKTCLVDDILQKNRKPMKQVSEKNRKKKSVYWSIFTEDMTVCYITGSTKDSGTTVDPHHIFMASDKAFSEKYGFMLPLRRDWHETANYSIHMDAELDLKFKLMCQDYWINTLHKTVEEWQKECRKWYVKKKIA